MADICEVQHVEGRLLPGGNGSYWEPGQKRQLLIQNFSSVVNAALPSMCTASNK